MVQKSRILLVEDESDVLRLNKLNFQAEGYEVICASTLQEARNAVWERHPDLILLDCLLPDGSGYDFCAMIRKVTAVPIIFLTCLANNADIVRGLSAGGDDYITKPYNLDVLNARVAAQLRRSESSRLGRIELPPLYIDIRSARAMLGGCEILLSQKELQLLAHFASNIGREFTSDQLYSAVWGETMVVPTNTVRMHISNLRNKLKLDGTNPFQISLTPNKGYVFLRTIDSY